MAPLRPLLQEPLRQPALARMRCCQSPASRRRRSSGASCPPTLCRTRRGRWSRRLRCVRLVAPSASSMTPCLPMFWLDIQSLRPISLKCTHSLIRMQAALAVPWRDACIPRLAQVQMDYQALEENFAMPSAPSSTHNSSTKKLARAPAVSLLGSQRAQNAGIILANLRMTPHQASCRPSLPSHRLPSPDRRHCGLIASKTHICKHHASVIS